METEPVQKPMSQKTRPIQFQCLQGKEADRSFGNHAGTSVQVGEFFVGKTEGADEVIPELWAFASIYAGCLHRPVRGVCIDLCRVSA